MKTLNLQKRYGSASRHPYWVKQLRQRTAKARRKRTDRHIHFLSHIVALLRRWAAKTAKRVSQSSRRFGVRLCITHSFHFYPFLREWSGFGLNNPFRWRFDSVIPQSPQSVNLVLLSIYLSFQSGMRRGTVALRESRTLRCGFNFRTCCSPQGSLCITGRDGADRRRNLRILAAILAQFFSVSVGGSIPPIAVRRGFRVLPRRVS